MVRETASLEDSDLEAILEALDDADCRAILRSTTEPMTATELSDDCDIPASTVYRKLERLSTAELVHEQDTINPGGGRVTRYERDFTELKISVTDDDTFAVSIERPSRSANERLADIWSKMGEQL